MAHDFEKADTWMAAVPKSYHKTDGTKIADAPMIGRVCEFTTKSNGLFADETILAYDEANQSMTVEVVPKNTPKVFPIQKNIVIMSVNSLGQNQSEVVWVSKPILKRYTGFLSPVLKMGLGKGFGEILEELKYFAEEGKPHPRKVKKASRA